MKYTPYQFKLKESQKEKLIYGKKNGEAVTLQIKKQQMNSGSDELYLTSTQIKKLSKMGNSARITLSKTQMKGQTGGFLGAIIPFIKAALPTVGKVLGTLALSGAAGAISGAANQAVKKKIGNGISLHIPSDEIQLLIESTGNLEQVNIVPKGTTEMIKNEMSEQRGGFIGTLIASLAGALLPSLLGGKGLSRAGQKKD